MLGVMPDAGIKSIKDAFRALALKFHPDRNTSDEAESHFKAIAEAYAVLSDPKKRAEYDARGFSGVAEFSAEELFDGINFENMFIGAGFDFDLGSGMFDRFFHHRRHGPPRGANIEVELHVPLQRVVSGGREPLRLQRPVECQDCHGQGRVTGQPCQKCAGRGKLEREEMLSVDIPVGVEEGMALRLAGLGLPSQETAGIPGDLFVVVHSLADPRFSRSGADLWCEETISLLDAVLGTSLLVSTLEGQASLTIPAGTQPGGILRLAGKGLPEFGGGHGDLYVKLQLQVPPSLSEQERTLYQQLRELAQRAR